jgi:SAM-dependent methyltransferase
VTHEPTPQNIYDDPAFFAGYSRLERFGAGWTRAVEHPAFMGLLPAVDGKRVLDLGCGAGQLAFHLAEAGAAEVVGVDISEQMLSLARSERAHPRTTYLRESLETVAFPPTRFDLVVSSLAFHYVEDYRSLVRRIAGWLVPGGSLVFSTEHPIYMAGASAGGWVRDDRGKVRHWAVDDYAEEGLREERWFVEGVRKHHRTFATLINGLLEAGFSIERVEEPVPSVEAVRERPDYAAERKRPMFLLVRARRA